MSVHTRRTGWVYTTALSWRGLAQRFSLLVFMLVSVGLVVIGQVNPVAVERFRARAVDGIAPIVDMFSKPVALIENISGRLSSYRTLVSENEALRQEVEKLRFAQNATIAIQNENKELRALLKYKTEPTVSYISARVIADAGGAYVRSFVVTAGRVDGVREGMAAMTGEGLVGRVVEVGDWTSRIILITDMNSRIPVMLDGTGEHAILSGDNGVHPSLLYLPQDSDVKVGARVMTSGHGGIFPPNIPVGVVTSYEHGTARISPFAAFGRINQVRLIDFNLAAGAVNPVAQKIQAAIQP